MLTNETTQAQDFWNFMRGNIESFLNRSNYTQQQLIIENMQKTFFYLYKEIQHYLEFGHCGKKVESLLDNLISEIFKKEPSLIGFSVMFPDQLIYAVALAYRISQTYNFSKRFLSTRPFKIIFGGALMTAIDLKELLKACPFIDAAVTGEGESPLTFLSRGLDMEKIPGLCRVQDHRILKIKRGLPINLDMIPAPDFTFFKTRPYANPVPVIPMILSRNCLWRRCRFCAHNFSFSNYRQKSINLFAQELEHLVSELNVRHFYLADQYVPAASLDALSDELLRRNLRINFHMMGRPTADYTPELLGKAATAGCRWISWGVETGSQRLLDLIQKGTHRDTIVRVLIDSHQAGIANLTMMIFGLPTSTDEDLNQTFEFIDDTYNYITAFTASSFALFKNTYFARHAQKFGLKIVKTEELFRVNKQPVHSNRLQYMHLSEGKNLAPPLGTIEISRWTNRRKWLGQVPFEENLWCEHFLLYVSNKKSPIQIHPNFPIHRKAA